ncbi:hypothetical protein R3P38DRAFT_2534766, partial [Favolaschia claudopus]
MQEILNPNLRSQEKAALDGLPLDVTSEIFLLALGCGRVPLKGEGSALILSHVCGWWRNVSLAVPRMWSTFHVDMEHDSLALMETYLLRSQKHPLSISLWPTKRQDAYLLGAIQPFIQSLKQHAEQWQDMEFTLPSTAILAIEHVDCPNLRSLALNVTGRTPSYSMGSQSDSRSSLSLAHRLPLLTAVVLNLAPSIVSPPPTLPWSKITKLEGNLTSDMATQVLMEAVLLKECQLTIYGDVHSGLVSSSIHLPHLQVLHLFSRQGAAVELMVKLDAPQLETMSL